MTQRITLAVLAILAIFALNGCDNFKNPVEPDEAVFQVDARVEGIQLHLPGIGSEQEIFAAPVSGGGNGGFAKTTTNLTLDDFRPFGNQEVKLIILDIAGQLTQPALVLGNYDDLQQGGGFCDTSFVLPSYDYFFVLVIGKQPVPAIIDLHHNDGQVIELRHIVHLYGVGDQGIDATSLSVQKRAGKFSFDAGIDNTDLITPVVMIQAEVSRYTRNLGEVFNDFPHNNPQHTELADYWLKRNEPGQSMATSGSNWYAQHAGSHMDGIFEVNTLEYDGQTLAYYRIYAFMGEGNGYYVHTEKVTIPSYTPLGMFFYRGGEFNPTNAVEGIHIKAVDYSGQQDTYYGNTFYFANQQLLVGDENILEEFSFGNGNGGNLVVINDEHRRVKISDTLDVYSANIVTQGGDVYAEVEYSDPNESGQEREWGEFEARPVSGGSSYWSGVIEEPDPQVGGRVDRLIFDTLPAGEYQLVLHHRRDPQFQYQPDDEHSFHSHKVKEQR